MTVYLLIMNIHLIEPYNAYTNAQGKKRKKHISELMEEEALYHKMVQDQLLREQQIQQAAQQVQDQAMAPAGAGGVPPYTFWQELVELANFSISPSSAAAPTLITFTNTTETKTNDTFYWRFGSGSLTSNLQDPATLVYYNVGTYAIQLDSTSSAGFPSTKSINLTLTEPTITTSFTATSGSKAAPYTASYVGVVTQTSQYPVTPSYLWRFYSGSTLLSSSTGINATRGWESGSAFTTSFTATNLFTTASTTSSFFAALNPTLVAIISTRTSSNIAPMTASITASYTYDGSGIVSGKVYDVIGGEYVFTTTPMMFETVQGSGSFTASLSLTESSYQNSASAFATPWSASYPSLTVTLTATTSSRTIPVIAKYTASYSYYGNGTVSGRILNNDGAGYANIENGQTPKYYEYTYASVGSYTGSVSVTESTYRLTATGSPYYISASAA